MTSAKKHVASISLMRIASRGYMLCESAAVYVAMWKKKRVLAVGPDTEDLEGAEGSNEDDALDTMFAQIKKHAAHPCRLQSEFTIR